MKINIPQSNEPTNIHTNVHIVLLSPLFSATVSNPSSSILCLKCDGTRAETRFRLSAKRTSPFKSTGASVQSKTGSRGVRISGSNAGYTMSRKCEEYWPPTPFASFPFTSLLKRQRVPSHFSWTLNIHPLTQDFQQ